MVKRSTSSPQQGSSNPLLELQSAVGKPDPALLDAYLEGTTDADLVDVGRTILTARVVTDCSRIYPAAWEFWQHASVQQKQRLRGFSPALLAIAVDQVVQLQHLETHHAGKSEAAAAARKVDETAAAKAFSDALGLRDQAFRALSDAACQDKNLLAEAATAKGTAEDAKQLASGLDRLAKLLRAWLKSEAQGLRGRLTLADLDAGYAKELAAAAKNVREAAAAASRRRAGGKVTQGQLDRGDGLNILLLGQVIGAFDAAHDLDPTIPRLVPISTRRLFNRRTAKKQGGDGGENATGGQEGAPPQGDS